MRAWTIKGPDGKLLDWVISLDRIQAMNLLCIGKMQLACDLQEAGYRCVEVEIREITERAPGAELGTSPSQEDVAAKAGQHSGAHLAKWCSHCKKATHNTSECHSTHMVPGDNRIVGAQPEAVAWNDLLGAVARGWCAPENEKKEMDSDLAVAIAKEVQSLYACPPAPAEMTLVLMSRIPRLIALVEAAIKNAVLYENERDYETLMAIRTELLAAAERGG